MPCAPAARSGSSVGEQHGIYGGKSERERRTMRRERTFGVGAAPMRVGGTITCQVDGCGYTATNPSGFGSHMAMHRRNGQRAGAA